MRPVGRLGLNGCDVATWSTTTAPCALSTVSSTVSPVALARSSRNGWVERTKLTYDRLRYAPGIIAGPRW